MIANKVYIAGKITGLENFKGLFEKAEIDLKSKGYVCMNPARLTEGFTHVEYMHVCTAMIDICDTVYMLNNWEDSKGAKYENYYAIKKDKDIIYEL